MTLILYTTRTSRYAYAEESVIDSPQQAVKNGSEIMETKEAVL
jgi:hypothetical protein